MPHAHTHTHAPGHIHGHAKFKPAHYWGGIGLYRFDLALMDNNRLQVEAILSLYHVVQCDKDCTDRHHLIAMAKECRKELRKRAVISPLYDFMYADSCSACRELKDDGKEG